MKKLNKLGILLSSIAMAAGAVTFSGAKNRNNISFRSDEYYERTGDSKGFYEKHNLEPVEAMSFASYTDNPGSTNVFNDDKNWYLDPISVGNTWNTYRGDGVTIAVIDTGLRSQHEDFYYNSIGKYNISEDSACFTHTGGNYYGVSTTYVKNGESLDWTVIENSTAGHGTNVTSTIASRINNKGTVGIAPNVNILFLKAATLYSDEVSEAIKYAADKYADIITMSLGCYSSSVIHGDLGDTDCAAKNIAYANGADSLYSTAINYAYGKGCMILASAGNEDVYSNSYPACNDHVIGVGALDKSSLTKKASYSNYNSTSASASGNHNVDVTAPGSVKVADKDSNTDYLETQGTSFSCPIVAGAMALYYQKNNYGGSTNVTTRKSNVTAATNALYNSCVDIGDTGWDRMYGYGALDISKLCGTDTTNVSSISVDKTSLTINEGFTKTATASISPIYSKNKFVNWTSSNSSVATVTSSTVTTAEATITGVSGGTCTITAKSADNASIYKTISVTVNGYVHSYFTATAKTDLTVGETTKINIDWDEGTPNDPSIMFDTSDEDVVTVDESGNVTAVGEGDGTIYIVSNDDEQEITFHVTKAEVGETSTISFIPADFSGSYSSSETTITKGDIDFGYIQIGNFSSSIQFKASAGQFYNKASLGKIVSIKVTPTKDKNVDGVKVGFGNTQAEAASATLTQVTSGGISGNNLPFFFMKKINSGAANADSIVIEYAASSSSGTTSYTVSFNSNGGSGTMNSQTTTGSFTVPSCTFTAPSGKEFDHWAIDSASGSTASGTISVTKDTTLYAVWKDKTTGGGSSDSGTYYDSITETSGLDLLGALHDLSIENHTTYTSYNGSGVALNTTYYIKTDRYENTDKVIDFWSGASTNNSGNSGQYDGWNREHVWPKSLTNGTFEETFGGSDIQHLRPTIPQGNSDHGSKPYGEISTNYSVSQDSSRGIVFGHYTSSVFEPMDNKKGDTARILMYVYMHYSAANRIHGTKDGSCKVGTLNFADVVVGNESQAISTLLKWNKNDPVDTIETTRNTEAAKITGCRNPFIDHPEYAEAIWGTVETIPVTDVSLDESSVQLTVGNTTTLTATVSPNNATNKNVTWESSNNSVATVNNGKITAKSAGNATITVKTVDGNKTDTCSVTVVSSGSGGGDGNYKKVKTTTDLTSGEYLIVSEGSSPIALNSSAQTIDSTTSAVSVSISNETIVSNDTTDSYSFTFNLEKGSFKTKKNNYIYHSGSSNSLNTDSSEQLNTVTIDNNGDAKIVCGSYILCNNGGRFRYYKTSSASSYATIQLYKKTESSTPIIDVPSVNSITLNKTALDFDLNGTKSGSITATVDADEGADYTLEWSSSNLDVATISGSGNNVTINGVGVGTSVITASAGEEEAKCTVTVIDTSPISVDGVSLDKQSLILVIGNEETLIATISPTNATNKNVTWSSSNSAAATVDSNGKVTAVSAGTAVITVKTVDGNYTATCTVTVNAAPTIEYRLEADETTVPYMSGTNHSVSVGVKLYQYTNGVKGSQVSSGTSNVDTSVLGQQEISYTYQSVVYKTTVKVTNNGASGNVGLSTEGISKTDTINATMLNATTTSYVAFSNVSDKDGSEAVYAGSSANNSGNMQFKSKDSNTGIVQTTSGGKVTSIKITIGSGTKTVDIYGKNSPYTSAGDLFDASKQGTKIGSTSSTTTINFDANNQYSYIGIRASDGAVYISKIEITCGAQGVSYPASPNDQAKAWADYFIRETRTLDTCLASTDAAKLSGLKNKWAELADEYGWMVSGAKDEFCTSTDSRIVEAREHYKYIVSKFGASNLGTKGNFVTNGQGTALNTNTTNRFSIVKLDNQTTLIVVISLISITSLGLYFYLKRKKEIE